MVKFKLHLYFPGVGWVGVVIIKLKANLSSTGLGLELELSYFCTNSIPKGQTLTRLQLEYRKVQENSLIPLVLTFNVELLVSNATSMQL